MDYFHHEGTVGLQHQSTILAAHRRVQTQGDPTPSMAPVHLWLSATRAGGASHCVIQVPPGVGASLREERTRLSPVGGSQSPARPLFSLSAPDPA